MSSQASALSAALSYIATGWGVFPLHGIVNGRCTCGKPSCANAGKHPLVRRGLYDATTDEATVREWFRRWRHANVAVVTGPGSGLVVVDIDMPKAEGSIARLVELDRALTTTRTAVTGGGGFHMYFEHPSWSLSNTTGRLPGIDEDLPGIDVRAAGGYVVAPPSMHRSGRVYAWGDETSAIAPLPEWMREPERAPLSGVAAAPANFSGDGTSYGLYVLRDELDKLMRAAEGSRNHQLNRAAFAVSQVVAGGELLEGAARDALLSAARNIGLDDDESRLTINSGFRAGASEPRSAPHRVT